MMKIRKLKGKMKNSKHKVKLKTYSQSVNENK